MTFDSSAQEEEMPSLEENTHNAGEDEEETKASKIESEDTL